MKSLVIQFLNFLFNVPFIHETHFVKLFEITFTYLSKRESATASIFYLLQNVQSHLTAIHYILQIFNQMSTAVIKPDVMGGDLIKRKLQLCRGYAEMGFCLFGQSCNFAHGLEELVMHQPILKKKMCRNFHQYKYCKFGSRCNFVHDPHHGFCPKKPKSMLKMMQEYPQLLTSLNFRKKLIIFYDQC